MFIDSAQAQSPEGFVYQAQLRNIKGHLIKNKELDLNVMILSSPDENTVVWERLYNVKTNKFGMVSIIIEDGDVPHFPPFSDIDWSHGTYYLYLELDNGHSVRGIGDPVLLYSVPYALHAKTCDNGVDTSNLEVGDILQFNGVGYEPATFAFYYQDKDSDGYGNENGFVYSPVRPTGFVDLGGDTDDHNPEINPGMDEVCGDGIDNNSDGTIDEFCNTDDDGDGFTELEGDCNDENELIHPGAAEITDDGIDNNCNGLIDEDSDEIDYDGDGFTELEGDCDDLDPIIYPGAVEQLDGIDNDCDGEIDEDFDLTDADSDGVSVAYGDCDDNNATVYPGAEELIDGIDNDCNGRLIDYEFDHDRDGYVTGTIDPNTGWLGDPYVVGGDDMDDNDNGSYPGALDICDGVDNDFDGIIDEDGDCDEDGFTLIEGDCNDYNETIYPGAPELIDGYDNNCDGQVEPDEANYDHDPYISGYYDANIWIGSSQIIGGGDCDDYNKRVYPGRPELIDGIDNDCDGELNPDEIDHDGDGYVHGNIFPTTGWVGDSNVIGGNDCDDNDPSINPGAFDIPYDDIDQNCDGLDSRIWYLDSDGDGFGGNNTVISNFQPTGYVSISGDCDDNNATVYPGAPELIDGIDNNCDGEIDETNSST